MGGGVATTCPNESCSVILLINFKSGIGRGAGYNVVCVCYAP